MFDALGAGPHLVEVEFLGVDGSRTGGEREGVADSVEPAATFALILALFDRNGNKESPVTDVRHP